MAILKQQQGLINAYGSCLGSWRQSEREDTGGERVAAAATRGIAPPSAPNSAGASSYDGILRAATDAPTGIEMRSTSVYSRMREPQASTAQAEACPRPDGCGETRLDLGVGDCSELEPPQVVRMVTR